MMSDTRESESKARCWIGLERPQLEERLRRAVAKREDDAAESAAVIVEDEIKVARLAGELAMLSMVDALLACDDVAEPVRPAKMTTLSAGILAVNRAIAEFRRQFGDRPRYLRVCESDSRWDGVAKVWGLDVERVPSVGEMRLVVAELPWRDPPEPEENTWPAGEEVSMPPMAHDRPYDWFKAGNRVVVYLHDWPDALDSTPRFVPLVVTERMEQLLNLYSDERLHTADNEDGHAVTCGVSSREVMLEWEFEYWQEHPSFAEVFARAYRRGSDNNFDADGFLAALQRSRQDAPDVNRSTLLGGNPTLSGSPRAG